MPDPTARGLRPDSHLATLMASCSGCRYFKAANLIQATGLVCEHRLLNACRSRHRSEWHLALALEAEPVNATQHNIDSNR